MNITYIICLNGIPFAPALPTLAEVLRRLELNAGNDTPAAINPETLPSMRTLGRHLGQKVLNPKTTYAQSIADKSGQTNVLTITKFVTL